MARPRRPEPPDECSQCGASIPRTAYACPGCGADEETGWDANPYLDPAQVDIPDYLVDDYDPATDGPVLPGESPRRSIWWYVAIAVAVFMIWYVTRHFALFTLKQD